MTTSFEPGVVAGAGLAAWAALGMMAADASTIATNDVIDFMASTSGVVEAVADFASA
jgi:hypothetical protein